MKNSGVAHIRGKGIDWEECEKMIGKYKNYKSVNVRPYDDADVVYTNNKVSVWVYCKPDEIQVIIFNYPLTKKVEDFGDDDLDEMHSKWNKELKVRFKKDSSTEEVVDWFKHILDKYA